MLKYRIITAIILLPLLIAAILKLPINYFITLVALITAIGAWEWSGFLNFSSAILRGLYVIVVILGLWLTFFIHFVPLMIIGILYLLWISFAIIRFNVGKTPLGLELVSIRLIAGILFFMCGFISIMLVRTMLVQYGPQWLLVMFIIIMAADTGAYFTGRLMGNKPLAINVSPKKTWAGFFGGMLFAVVASIIGSLFFQINWHSRFAFWCLSLVAAIFSVIGDLSISVLKRQTKLKDSGSILPGHGGFLDRMDSIYAGMIIFAFSIFWL